MENCGYRFCHDPDGRSNNGVVELTLGPRYVIVRSISHGLAEVNAFCSTLRFNDQTLLFLASTRTYLLTHPHLPWI